MKNFRVRRIHIVCLAIATAEILIAAFVLWKNAIWNETQIQTANQQSVLSETQEETTSDIQENEKTATQNQEETKKYHHCRCYFNGCHHCCLRTKRSF